MRMRNRRTFRTSETIGGMRRHRKIIELEARRAKRTGMKTKDAGSAKATINTSYTNVMQNPSTLRAAISTLLQHFGRGIWSGRWRRKRRVVH